MRVGCTVLIVNDTMFAHGGVLMGHVQYGLERINAEVSAWMRGDRLGDGSRAPPPFLAMGCAPPRPAMPVAWGTDVTVTSYIHRAPGSQACSATAGDPL